MVIAQNPVRLIKTADIERVYQRVHETPERVYDFIDVRAKNGFYTFTLEDMSDEKAVEFIETVRKFNPGICPEPEEYEK
jgi:hypothetical protein